MTVVIVNLFLSKMLPLWPHGYTPWEREILMRDTDLAEIARYAPELVSQYRT